MGQQVLLDGRYTYRYGKSRAAIPTLNAVKDFRFTQIGVAEGVIPDVWSSRVHDRSKHNRTTPLTRCGYVVQVSMRKKVFNIYRSNNIQLSSLIHLPNNSHAIFMQYQSSISPGRQLAFQVSAFLCSSTFSMPKRGIFVVGCSWSQTHHDLSARLPTFYHLLLYRST